MTTTDVILILVSASLVICSVQIARLQDRVDRIAAIVENLVRQRRYR